VEKLVESMKPETPLSEEGKGAPAATPSVAAAASTASQQ
jgi:hypothetical protein